MDPTAEVRARLHARARIFIDESSAGRRTTDDFDRLGLDIAAYQADRVPGYARLLAAARVRPRDAATLRSLPAVPTDAFRFARIAAHAPVDDVRIFRTSGTTAAARGEHALSTTKTYESAAITWGRWALFFDAPAGMSAVILGARGDAGGDSSLGFMIDLFADRFAARSSYAQPGAGEPIEKSALVAALDEACANGAPAIVMGTSFAFVHALDALAGARFTLPPGSRAMHTGGFKGRSREVAPDVLRVEIARALGLEGGAVVGEYGMTELSSQLYEGTLRALRGAPVAHAEHGAFLPPPWMRVTAVEPETLALLPEGETGILRFEDLANVDGAVAVQTADLGRCRAVDGRALRSCARRAAPRVLARDRGASRSMSAESHDRRVDRVLEVLSAARRLADASDPLGREARRLLPEATGLSREGVALGLERHLETSAPPEDLARLVARTPEAPRVHVVLSANVFVGAVRALALAVAACPAVSIRPSSREAIMAPLLVRALVEASASMELELGELQPNAGDIVHVYGRRETIDVITREAPRGVRIVGHGPGFGIALVDAAAVPLELAAERLSWDVVAFDQRGCLSPRIAFVRGSPPEVEAFGGHLARELERREAEVPRGRLAEEERRESALYRQTAHMLGQCHLGTTSVVGVDLAPREVPLPPPGRNVHVARIEGADDALRLAARFRAAITSIGSGPKVAPSNTILAPLAAFFRGARTMPLGAMQSPPLDGPVDLRGVV
jgi:hypothetical protein